jgi:hypothetical protein
LGTPNVIISAGWATVATRRPPCGPPKWAEPLSHTVAHSILNRVNSPFQPAGDQVIMLTICTQFFPIEFSKS